MLISFEGIDGCGKSTQIELLKSYLKNKDISCHVFREPGGTDLSEKIRDLLLHEKGDIHPVSELLLFSAARSQLVAEKMIPLLQKNEIVILDRFYDSTTAYQGYGRSSTDIEQISVLNGIASHQTKPDLTFYLRISPDLAAQRTSGVDKDRMERSGLDFFKRVFAGYDLIAEKEDRFQIIDATMPPDAIHSSIVDYFDKKYKSMRS